MFDTEQAIRGANKQPKKKLVYLYNTDCVFVVIGTGWIEATFSISSECNFTHTTRSKRKLIFRSVKEINQIITYVDDGYGSNFKLCCVTIFAIAIKCIGPLRLWNCIWFCFGNRVLHIQFQSLKLKNECYVQ